jgi:hypothetical protein
MRSASLIELIYAGIPARFLGTVIVIAFIVVFMLATISAAYPHMQQKNPQQAGLDRCINIILAKSVQ